MAPSRKRRISEPVSSNDEAPGSSSSPTPTPAKKKSKRQSMNEQRAAAAEWAKNQAAKKASSRASIGTSIAVASHSPMVVQATTAGTPLTGAGGTPISSATPKSTPTVTKKSPAASAIASGASTAQHSTVSPRSTLSKKQKRIEDKERARRWAQEKLFANSNKDAQTTPRPIVQQQAQVTPKATSTSTPLLPRKTTTGHKKSTTTVPEASGAAKTQEVGQSSIESNPEGDATITTTTTTVFVEERVETIPIPVQANAEEEEEEESEDAPPSPTAEEVGRVLNGPAALEELGKGAPLSGSRISCFSRLIIGLKKFVKGVMCLIAISGAMCFIWMIYRDLVATILKEWNEEGAQLPSAPKHSPSKERPIYCYMNDAETEAQLKRSEESLSPVSSPYVECKKNAENDLSRLPRKPCPMHGICNEGIFHRCAPDHLFVKVLGKHRKKFGAKPEPYCALTPLGDRMRKVLDDIVEDWTLDCSCGGKSCASAIDGARNATFWLEDVVNAMEERVEDISKGDDNGLATEESPFSFRSDIPLLSGHLEKAEILEEGKGEGLKRLVSLSKKARSRLSVPFGCWLKKWGHFVLTFLLESAGKLLGLCIQLTVAYPTIVSLSSLIGLWLWRFIIGRRKKDLLCKQAAEARKVAYEKLVYEARNGKNEGYGIPILREDVAQTMFPNSLEQRNAFSMNVWPRVTREMRRDIRIQSIQRNIGGSAMDCWIWNGNAASSNSTPGRT